MGHLEDYFEVYEIVQRRHPLSPWSFCFSLTEKSGRIFLTMRTLQQLDLTCGCLRAITITSERVRAMNIHLKVLE